MNSIWYLILRFTTDVHGLASMLPLCAMELLQQNIRKYHKFVAVCHYECVAYNIAMPKVTSISSVSIVHHKPFLFLVQYWFTAG